MGVTRQPQVGVSARLWRRLAAVVARAVVEVRHVPQEVATALSQHVQLLEHACRC